MSSKRRTPGFKSILVIGQKVFFLIITIWSQADIFPVPSSSCPFASRFSFCFPRLHLPHAPSFPTRISTPHVLPYASPMPTFPRLALQSFCLPQVSTPFPTQISLCSYTSPSPSPRPIFCLQPMPNLSAVFLMSFHTPHHVPPFARFSFCVSFVQAYSCSPQGFHPFPHAPAFASRFHPTPPLPKFPSASPTFVFHIRGILHPLPPHPTSQVSFCLPLAHPLLRFQVAKLPKCTSQPRLAGDKLLKLREDSDSPSRPAVGSPFGWAG